MKKHIPILLVVLSFWLGCSMLNKAKEQTTSSNKQPVAVEEKKASVVITPPKVGDSVIAKWSSSSYHEGKVKSIDGTKAKIIWAGEQSEEDVDMTNVYPLPKAKTEVTAGDFVLAKSIDSDAWYNAQVEKIGDGFIEVKQTSEANTFKTPADRIIKVSGITAEDFKKELAETNFTSEATKHRPIVLDNYVPKVGEKVLAEWTENNWYTGKVKKVSADKINIAWLDNSNPSDVSLAGVAPLPEGNSELPSANDYILVKENNNHWLYAQVISAIGNNIEVKFADRENQTIKSSDFAMLR